MIWLWYGLAAAWVVVTVALMWRGHVGQKSQKAQKFRPAATVQEAVSSGRLRVLCEVVCGRWKAVVIELGLWATGDSLDNVMGKIADLTKNPPEFGNEHGSPSQAMADALWVNAHSVKDRWLGKSAIGWLGRAVKVEVRVS